MLKAYVLRASILTLALSVLGKTIMANDASTRQEAVDNANHFAFRLFSTLGPTSHNLCIAPIGVRSALSILRYGASGPTERQLSSAIGFRSEVEDQVRQLRSELEGDVRVRQTAQCIFSVAVWHTRDIVLRDDFEKNIVSKFNASLFVDAVSAEEGAKRMNEWVAEKTKGRIRSAFLPEQIGSVSSLTIADTIYFKAPWLHPIDEGQTRNCKFTLQTGENVEIPTMHFEAALKYSCDEGWKAVTIPYDYDHAQATAKRMFEIVIILPQPAKSPASMIDGFSEMKFDRLTAKVSSPAKAPRGENSSVGATVGSGPELAGRGTTKIKRVSVALPRFSLNTFVDLAESVQRLEAGDIFTPNADFSKASISHLAVSKVFQESFLSVDERGTEAASATGVCVFGQDDTLENIAFDASNPFLFVVREQNSGLILFMGMVEDPRQPQTEKKDH